VLGSLVEYLRDSIDDYLELLNHYLLKEQLAAQDAFQKQDAILLFQAHVAILEQLLKAKNCPPLEPFRRQFETEIGSFLELSRRCQSLGIGLSVCIRFFRAVDQSLTRLIISLAFNDATKIEMLTLFSTQIGVLDTVLAEHFESMVKGSTMRDLEAVNQVLMREKITYKNIFEGTSNLVLMTDGEGMVVEANPEALIFFSRQKLIGYFCGTPLGLTGRDLSQLLNDFPPNQLHEVALQVDNTCRYFNLQIKPLDGSLNTDSGIMLILSDITCIVDHRQLLEQRVFERTVALASSEKLLGAIFHAVGKGIILIDTDGEIVKANQQASEIFGVPLEVLIGTQMCDLTNSDGCKILRDAKQKLLEGQQFSAEIRSVYVDGKDFPSVITMTRMDLDGKTFWPIIVRDITEQKILDRKLREEKQHAEEMNVTLRNVLKSIENDRKDVENCLSERIRSSILPGIEKIRRESHADVRQGYLTLLKDQLISLTRDFEAGLDGDLLKLTKKELKICQFIKAGLSGKEICETLNLSFETIQTHRKNIRKKLGLRGREESLQQFLMNKNCDF